MTVRSFDPQEFLRVADSLVSQDTSEASLRTAVGRIYYAVFLTARETLGVSGRSRIHGRVIGELRRRDRYAGGQLEKLEGLRVVADYQLDVQSAFDVDWRRNYQMARRLANFVLGRLQ